MRGARSNGSAQRRLLELTEASAWVGLCAFAAFLLSHLLLPADLSLVYLAGVVAAAIRGGLAAAIYASIISVLSFNFLFTAPRYSLAVTDHSDILTLTFFLLVAITTSHLAASGRRHLALSRAQARTNGLLYDFSRRLAGAVNAGDVALSLAEHVREILGYDTVVLLDTDERDSPPALSPIRQRTLTRAEREIAEIARVERRSTGRGTPVAPACRWRFFPLRIAEDTLGILGVSDPDECWQLPAEQERTLLAMRDQASVSMERMHLAQDVAKAQVRAEADELRAALLSSVSHDLRTPLVSIIGSVSTLLELPQLSAQDRRELLLTTLDEAERLNRFVQNLLDMTRLGGNRLNVCPSWVDLRDLLAEAQRRLKRSLDAHPLKVDIAPQNALVYLDGVLLQQVMINLLDNATRYSPEGTPILVHGQLSGLHLVVEVTDSGPGIPAEQREAVFDMFHRVARGDGGPAGTGLGLAICRGLIHAMGGTIVIDAPPSGQGTVVRLSLPVQMPEAEETSH